MVLDATLIDGTYQLITDVSGTGTLRGMTQAHFNACGYPLSQVVHFLDWALPPYNCVCQPATNGPPLADGECPLVGAYVNPNYTPPQATGDSAAPLIFAAAVVGALLGAVLLAPRGGRRGR
jgi:hypothetical protein